MLGVGRNAGRSYRALEPSTAPKTDEGVSVALLALSEARFQRIVVGYLRLRGWTCWTVPNMRLTTAGLPDVLAWHAGLPGLILALELKRERDYRVTPAQTVALAHLETVPGIDARILRPSGWERLRDTLDYMLQHTPGCPADEGESQ